jgi:hypothetical protein
MDEYQNLASRFNSAAKVPIATGAELPTTLAHSGQSLAFHNLAMSRMDQAQRFKKIWEDYQLEQAKKANEAGPLDFLSVLPGIGGIYSAIAKGGK